MDQNKETQFVSRGQYILLAIIGTFASVLVLPYSLHLSRGLIDSGVATRQALISSSIIQGVVISWGLLLAGIVMGKKVGLGRLYTNPQAIRRTLTISILWGVAVSAFMIVSDLLIVSTGSIVAAEGVTSPGWLKGLGAIFYGGFVEEFMTRAFLVSGVVFIISLIRKESGRQPGWSYLLAIVFASIVFAAGHLGAAAASHSLTGVLVLRTALLNIIPGLVFGMLYWKRGLAAAIGAHLTVDVCVHVLFALFTGA